MVLYAKLVNEECLFMIIINSFYMVATVSVWLVNNTVKYDRMEISRQLLELELSTTPVSVIFSSLLKQGRMVEIVVFPWTVRDK